MKRLILAAAATFALLVVSLPQAARAEMAPGEHRNGSLGFHNDAAPVGVRWWFSGQKVGLDLGVGFGSSPAPSFPDEKLTNWGIDVGIPFVLHSWDRVHFMVRPGLLYQSQQFESTAPPLAFDTEDGTTLFISGELEAEVFLADNFSVSASHGFGYSSFDPPGPGDSVSSFSTFGNNFTNVGFHVYLFGGGGSNP